MTGAAKNTCSPKIRIRTSFQSMEFIRMKMNMNYIDGIMDTSLFEKARNEKEDEEVEEEEEEVDEEEEEENEKSRDAERDGEDDCHFYFEIPN